MVRIASYVFLDLETTSIPEREHNKTRITELSMLVVKREHLIDNNLGELPRVLSKLTMCFNPGRLIDQGATDASGLDNFLLEHETKFDMNAFNTINSFLDCQQKPVCLIAENGHNFDFPIFKNHIEKLNVALGADIMCADSLHAFFDILEKEKLSNTVSETDSSEISTDCVDNNLSSSSNMANLSSDVLTANDENSFNNLDKCSDLEWRLAIQKKNECTPKHTGKFKAPKNIRQVKRRLYFKKDNTKIVPKPVDSYKLKDIYERVLGRSAEHAHRAENDCILTAEISVAKAKEFIEWVDDNYCPFSEVKAMTLGVSLLS